MIVLACGAGAGVSTLTVKAKDDIDDWNDRLSAAVPGAQLNKQLTNLTKIYLMLGAAIAGNCIPMFLFLLLRWNHPSRTNPKGFIQRFRPLILPLLTGQFFLISFGMAIITSIYIAGKSFKIEPDVSNPDALAQRLGFKLPYKESGYLLGLIGLWWVLFVIEGISFGLEFISYRKFKAVEGQMDGGHS